VTVALIAADDPSIYGGKAVQLGQALRAGLPVPEGVALGWADVDAVAAGHASLDDVALPSPCSVRSSAVDEDSADASFAGAHLTVLGVEGCEAVRRAVTAVRASAYDPGAVAYRTALGLDASPRMAVVVQRLVDSDVAGVMFTRNPMTGADECVIEASWGLGEAVVAGLVTPDHWVLDASGQMTTFLVGEKDIAIRRTASGTAEVPVDDDLIETPCLDDTQLAALHELAITCDRVYGSRGHDIEFAFAGGELYLLQRRPITRG
jgi:pyruvate, water dikinase